jgi:multiple sugar transport system substrate-binding protein
VATGDSTGATSGGADYVPPKTSTRLIAIIAALLVVTNVITAVGVYYTTAPKAGVVAVQVIGPWAGDPATNSEWGTFKPILDKFTNDTGIPYVYTPTRQEDLTPTLPIAFQAGQSPADLIFMPSATIKQWAAKNWVTELTGTIGPSTYQTGALDPLTVSGKIWGGAYTGKVKPGFWYNTTLFTSNGWSVPTTWQQYWSLLGTIKNATGRPPILAGDGVGWPLSDVVEHFLETYGGAAMHKGLMSRTLNWTDASVKAVFQNYLVPTLTSGFWTAPTTWDNPGVTLWWGGTNPLYFMGSWITGMVPNPSALGVFSLPGGTSSQGIVFAADYFFVPRYGPHQDLGKRLAAYLGSEAAQELQVRKGGHIATAANVPLSAYPTVDQKVANLLTGKTVLSDLDDTIGNPFQGKFWSELQRLWTNPAVWNSVLTNIQTAAAAQP